MDSIKKFVVAVGLISDQIICNKCNKECHLEVQSDLIPEVKDLQWRCSICRKKLSIFHNSTFSGMRISLQEFHLLLQMWCKSVLIFIFIIKLLQKIETNSSTKYDTRVDKYYYFKIFYL